MHKRPFLGFCVLMLAAIGGWAGGNPEFVKFPAGYHMSFTHYATLNRAGQPLLAKMYANAVAVTSYTSGLTAVPGSIFVMEIYQPKLDASGQPVAGAGGLYEQDALSGIAVMERRDDWAASFPGDQRLAGWGFAIYNPDGTPKENNLTCVQCHQPLGQQDHLFTQQNFLAFVKGQ